MQKFFFDMLEVVRFRFKPLSSYVYPAWQPLLTLALVALLGAIPASEIQTGLAGRAAFFFMLRLAETTLLSLWLMLWWRFILRRPFTGSVFPLLVLCVGPHFFAPLVALLPLEYGGILGGVIAGYSLVLMVSAVAASLGERRRTVVVALLASLPLAFMLVTVMFQLMASLGWISLEVVPTK